MTTANTPFSQGDIVKLASEEKLMTVCATTHNTVECIWLDPNLKPVYHEFPYQTLILVQRKPSA